MKVIPSAPVKWWMVFAFGGLGALGRVALLGLFPVHSALLGTLLVNVLGCLPIGVLFQWFEVRELLSAEVRTGLVAGLLGGFTTFSAFGLELLELLEEGRLLAGIGYASGSVLLAVSAAALGALLARQVL
jgi:CrcB protein